MLSILKNKRMKLFLLISGIIGFILVTILIILIINFNETYKRENLTLDQFIVFTATDKLGRTNMGEIRVYGIDKVDNIKRIFLNADENFTDEMSVDGCIIDTIDMMKIFVQDDEFITMSQEGISFQWIFNTIDLYGNENDTVGVIITFMKDDINKIKWESVPIDGIKEVSHNFWINDFLKD